MMSVRVDEEPVDSRRRRWWIAGMLGILLSASAARIWLYEAPAEQLQLQIPQHATFRYGRFVEVQDETGSHVVWHVSPIPAETGRTLVDLVQHSEQQEYGRWGVQFNWPPIQKDDELIRHRASFYVTTTPIQLDFEDESTFINHRDGLYIVPEGSRAELGRLLDTLDAQCQTDYEQQQSEVQTPRDERNHEEFPDDLDEGS